MSTPIRSLAVVAPAGPVPRDRFRQGLHVLEGLGRMVEVFFDQSAKDDGGFLAAPDAQRTERFLEAAASGADAIITARGGYGAYRLLRRLPAAAPGASARMSLIGFSDVTALLLGLSQRWGWSAVHGPNVTTLADLDGPSLAAFRALLDEPGGETAFHGLESLHPGQGKGPLLGGNLSVLCSLLGTPAEPDLTGCILFIEDVGEAPYRLDRLLHHLASCRSFHSLAGLVVGDLGRGENDAVRRSLRAICAEHGLPAAAGLPVGHGASNHPLIFGATAVLDAGMGDLRLRPV